MRFLRCRHEGAVAPDVILRVLADFGAGHQRCAASHDKPAAVLVAGLYSQPIQPS
jgi:hypothetical protein